MIRFYNRERELEFLEQQYGRNSLVVVYGRRRIGKTELIKKFLEGKPHIYFLTSQEPSRLQLERLIRKVSEYFGERPPQIDDWVDGLDYIGGKLISKKLILVIDEFPYLIDVNPSIPSYFQRLSDEHLKNSNSMLILAGSSISMMESQVLGHKSPLYGRRTGQIDLQPFDFVKLRLMIKKGMEEQIVVNSVFGNVPMYLSFFDNKLSLRENLLTKILDKRSFLYKEPEFILKQELREPANYMAILAAIAGGSSKLNEISTKTGIAPGTLSKYVEQLKRLRLIKREVSVTERSKKSKKSLYFIDDGLFNFWFRFIEPNLSDVEDSPEKILEQHILVNLPSFTSETYERVCREFIRKTEEYGKTGRWWHRDKEIDIVALNELNSEILFCECKWSDDIDAGKVLSELKEKAEHVVWRNSTRREKYAVFAKSFKSKKPMDAMLFDLTDLERMMK